MRKTLSALLISSLLSACSAKQVSDSTGSATGALSGSDEAPVPTDTGDPSDPGNGSAAPTDDTDDPPIELMDQALIDADPDAYAWLTDGGASLQSAAEVLCSPRADVCPVTVATAQMRVVLTGVAVTDLDSTPMPGLPDPLPPADPAGPTTPADPTAPADPLPSETTCSASMAGPKTVTVRKLIARFLKNSWSKLVQSGNEAAGKVLNKLLNNKALTKEAQEVLAEQAKKYPNSATDALKGFMDWVKKQPKSKIALGIIGVAITAGALPFVLDQIKDAIKTHILGIETQEQKVKKLEKEIEDLKAKIKPTCGDGTPADPDDELLKQLDAKLDELSKAYDELEKLADDLSAELDAIEKALEDIGLDKIDPDPAK
jgi:chaperonin cofactor prefoldin